MRKIKKKHAIRKWKRKICKKLKKMGRNLSINYNGKYIIKLNLSVVIHGKLVDAFRIFHKLVKISRAF